MEEDDAPLRRFRSKCFRDKELRVLLKLIAKYKTIVFSKSITNAAIREREITWEKIAEEFNKETKDIEREASVLKRKWDSLRKNARKESTEDIDYDSNKDDITRMVLALNAVENGCQTQEDMDLIYGKAQPSSKSNLKIGDTEDWSYKDKSCDDESQDEGNDKPKTEKLGRARTMLSPFECKLLLDAVRQEKEAVFTSKSNGLKQRAWKKITEAFNKQSPRKRTANELSKSFQAMKKVTQKVNMSHMYRKREMDKYETLNNSGHDKKIKMETTDPSDSEGDDKNVFEIEITNGLNSTNKDPLGANATSRDSGLGIADSRSNKDINNLRLELLNYEMETAKMQRKRLEQAIEAERYEREMRATEISLRIRAARLEVISAEAKFDPTSPALAYTAQEARGQTYMQEFLRQNQ